MSLKDDIEVAQRLFSSRLSNKTKPTEREALTAAARLLEYTAFTLFEGSKLVEDGKLNKIKELFEVEGVPYHRAAEIPWFLHCLAYAFDPPSVPESDQSIHTRKINFSDASQGAAKMRAAYPRHFIIAFRVYELRKAGEKAPVRKAAEEFNINSEEVSRICARPDIKQNMMAWAAFDQEAADRARRRSSTP